VTITAIPTMFQTSRRVATTMFWWILPTRPPMATDGKAHRNGPRRDCSVSCTTANSSGPAPLRPNDWKALRLILAILPQPYWF